MTDREENSNGIWVSSLQNNILSFELRVLSKYWAGWLGGVKGADKLLFAQEILAIASQQGFDFRAQMFLCDSFMTASRNSQCQIWNSLYLIVVPN